MAKRTSTQPPVKQTSKKSEQTANKRNEIGKITVKAVPKTHSVPTIEEIIVSKNSISKPKNTTKTSRKANSRERKLAIKTLSNYVDGIEQGKIKRIMNTLDKVVEFNRRITARTLLERKYAKMLGDTSAISFHFKVKDVSIYGDNIARVSGDTKIKYQYANQPHEAHEGLMQVDIKLKGRKTKIIAINQL